MKSLHFGSAVIDIVTLVDSEKIERATFTNDGKSFLMLEAGRKIEASSITSHVGGGACNTAVSLARRGWQATVLAKVGQDLNAAAVREHLERNDVGHRLLACPRATGTAVMISSHDRNASIFVHRGANETLAEADLPDFAGFDLVYMAPMSNDSADCFPVIAERARSAGAMVAANPGLRQLTSRTQAFLETLPFLDLVSLNRVEAEALIPALHASAMGPEPHLPEECPPLLHEGLSGGGFEMGLITFLRALQAAGSRWVLVTDGIRGAYLAGPDLVLWHPSIPVEVAGTAGAGDAFSSTLAGALAEGHAAEEALAEAAANAASVVAEIDTTSGLMSAEDLKGRAKARRHVSAVRLPGCGPA